MQIVITGRRVDLSDDVKAYIEDKFDRLTRFYDRIQRIDVVVDRGENAFAVEGVVNAEHNVEFVSSVSADDVRSATDAVIQKLERQLTDHKSKFRNRKHPGR